MWSRKGLLILVIVSLLIGGIFTDSSTTSLAHEDSADTRILTEESLTIVFDMSHGQYSEQTFVNEDAWLEANLTYLGYTVVWAWGGLNATILDGAIGLVIGAIFQTDEGFTPTEISAIADWFNSGDKFLWIAADSDYGGYNSINMNATAILEAVGSHVYPEPTSIEDPESNCDGVSYRVVANRTSENQFVASVVDGVSNVLMHGPTLLYGSNSSNPGFGVEPVALETASIENVYPLLYYSEAATILDSDLIPPLAHSEGLSGSYVANTMETNLGDTNSSIVVVSGASPYAGFKPMSTTSYFREDLDGDVFVRQLIDYSIKLLTGLIVSSPDDIEYEEGVLGYSIEWEFFGPEVNNYSIELDGVVVREGLCNSSTEVISILVDGLSAGTYNYTVLVSNENITKSDTVFVTVYEVQAPTINHPEDLVYYAGENESVIDWHPDDMSLYYYEIFKNDSLIQTHYWLPDEPTSITLNVGNLPVGEYNYTIQVHDKLMQTVSDTVIVQVLPATTITTTTITTTATTTTTSTNTTTGPFDLFGNLTIIISLGSVVVIVVIVVMIFRNRK